jgi:hypothetical protein
LGGRRGDLRVRAVAAGVTGLGDRASLPSDVRLAGGSLQDLALGRDHLLLGSAPIYLPLLAAGYTFGEIVDAVSQRFALPPSQVRDDLFALVRRLNAARLLNLHPCGGPWSWPRRAFVDLVRAAVTGIPPYCFSRRYPIQSRRIHDVLIAVAHAILSAKAATWVLLVAFSLAFGALVSLAVGAVVAATAIGLVMALTIHEAAHALAALRWQSGCFLIASAWGPLSVVHRAGPRDGWIAAAGPATAGGCGLLVWALALSLGSPIVGAFALPFLAQLFGLTVLFRDGRLFARSAWRTV